MKRIQISGRSLSVCNYLQDAETGGLIKAAVIATGLLITLAPAYKANDLAIDHLVPAATSQGPKNAGFAADYQTFSARLSASTDVNNVAICTEFLDKATSLSAAHPNANIDPNLPNIAGLAVESALKKVFAAKNETSPAAANAINMAKADARNITVILGRAYPELLNEPALLISTSSKLAVLADLPVAYGVFFDGEPAAAAELKRDTALALNSLPVATPASSGIIGADRTKIEFNTVDGYERSGPASRLASGTQVASNDLPDFEPAGAALAALDSLAVPGN